MGLKIDNNSIKDALEKFLKAAEEIKSLEGQNVDNAILEMGGNIETIHDLQPMTKDPALAQKAAKSEKDKEHYVKQENKKIELMKLLEKKFK